MSLRRSSAARPTRDVRADVPGAREEACRTSSVGPRARGLTPEKKKGCHNGSDVSAIPSACGSCCARASHASSVYGWWSRWYCLQGWGWDWWVPSRPPPFGRTRLLEASLSRQAQASLRRAAHRHTHLAPFTGLAKRWSLQPRRMAGPWAGHLRRPGARDARRVSSLPVAEAGLAHGASGERRL